MAYRLASSFRVAVIAVSAAAAMDVHVRALSVQDLEQHVALSIDLLELSVAEWTERVAVPAGDSAEARAEARAAIEKKFKAERAKLYERYLTSDKAHMTFFATHGADVDGYFEEHPEVKERIDTLSQTLRTLVAQAESGGGPPGAPR